MVINRKHQSCPYMTAWGKALAAITCRTYSVGYAEVQEKMYVNKIGISNCKFKTLIHKLKAMTLLTVFDHSNSNSTFIALNLYLMIDSKTQKAKIRDRNH